MKSYEISIHSPPECGGSDAVIELLTTVDLGGAQQQTVVARAGLWWRDTPEMAGEKVAAIGGFSAEDGEATRALLEGATTYLRGQGRRTAIGPLDGNTWQSHRFVIAGTARGPFLLEPRNPLEYPDYWKAAGFSVLSSYSSSVMALDGAEVISPAVRARLAKMAVVVRKIIASNYDDELRKIYAVSLKSFAANFLYTPLAEDLFLVAYQKVREWVDPDLVMIAERHGQPCGFVFGIPDHEARARGERPALIVKTLAVDPQARCGGLGSLLVDELHRSGREKGYTEAIHALQHETNSSLKITGRHQGEVFRRYALFSKVL